jgi:hypothetical protein
MDRTNNATIEVIIEEAGFNNSLAGYWGCPNSQNDNGGKEMTQVWVSHYLQDGTFITLQLSLYILTFVLATDRLSKMIEGMKWTIADTYAAQTMCPYETVAYGFSKFCDLFDWKEWEGYGYSVDLGFAGNSGFQSSTGVSRLLIASQHTFV